MTATEAQNQGRKDALIQFKQSLSVEGIRATAKAAAAHHPQGEAYLRGVELFLARPVDPAAP